MKEETEHHGADDDSKREDRTEILRMNDGEKEPNSDAGRWAETGSECRIGPRRCWQRPEKSGAGGSDFVDRLKSVMRNYGFIR
ncbi:hypothetical protein AHAS_Ahas18G0142100 [Arachis hypogaea]